MNSTLFIQNIREKTSDFKKRCINEAQTKEWLIKPFFETLGWDFSNPEEVVPEDDDSTGKKPDYGFYFNKKVKFFVEAKSINTNIDDQRIVSDKLNYCNNANVPFLIITNGVDYRIYYIGLKGTAKDRILLEFTLTEDIDEDIVNKLSKDSIEKDTLFIYAKNISVFSNVKSALEKIFQKPSKKIIDTINEGIKSALGHKFGDDDIRDALKHFNLEISDDVYSGNENFDNQKTNDKDENSIWTIEHQFKNGKWKNSFELYNKLKSYISNSNIKYIEKPTKFYINLIQNDINFAQVHGQSSGLKIWLTINFDDLSEQEKLKTRDVANIGHWGMGNTECFVKNENDFEWFLNIIKKIIN
ncbi:MAG: type I restriction enzyme HsdR N-terminal domain-containing protein [Ignavibacteriales bacterium]|nr:type I restriction enzyme HsdR N-terminal domain-containing protein [Ignavibacteriales bacterium]